MPNHMTLDQKDFISLVKASLDNNHQVRFQVTGHSMKPFLKHEKTYVTIQRKTHYVKGDIILFKYQQKVLLHRIIHVNDMIYTCQGDALKTSEIIKDKDIIGVVFSYGINKEKRVDHKWYKFKVKLWLSMKRIMMRWLT